MTGSLKRGKNRRGISYQKRDLEDMIDQGLSIREMADILGTHSLQSVRHAVERIKRERDQRTELQMKIERDSMRKPVRRAGIFPYSVSDHNLKALDYVLSSTETGASMINTPKGKAILLHPYFQNTAGKLYSLGFSGRLCSNDDMDTSIEVLYASIKKDEEPPFKKLFGTIVKVEYSKKDEEKLQAMLFPYIENGSIYFRDFENIIFTKTSLEENILESLQQDTRRNNLHIHLKYNPMIVADSGYVPLEIKGNVMVVISHSTEKNLENIFLREMNEQTVQIAMKTEMYRMQNLSRDEARAYAIMEQLESMRLEIKEEIPVFPTDDQRREIEEVAARNTSLFVDRIDQAFLYINDLIKRSSRS